MEELGLAPLTGFAAFLVTATVAGIDALKVYVLRGWARRIPAIVFYALAIAVPTAVCIYFSLDWFAALAGDEMPESLATFSTAATGVLCGLTASLSYKGKETAKALAAAKLLADGKPVPPYLTPPGEPGIPAPEPCPEPEPMVEPIPVAPGPDPGLANSDTKVTMFLKLTGMSDATYVLIEDETGQRVYPVSVD